MPSDRRSDELELTDALNSKVQYQSVVLSTEFQKGAAKTTPITGEVGTLGQQFIRTGELQDFETCKRLME